MGPTPARAQLPPLTLKTGPNWPKNALFTFPKGRGSFLGKQPFPFGGGNFWAQNWRFRGHTNSLDSKRGKSRAFRGARWVKTVLDRLKAGRMGGRAPPPPPPEVRGPTCACRPFRGVETNSWPSIIKRHMAGPQRKFRGRMWRDCLFPTRTWLVQCST